MEWDDGLGPKPFLMQLSVYVVKTQNPFVT
jgi:hypothetical protein